MNNGYWILDTRSKNTTEVEGGFFGFLFGKQPGDYVDHILSQARRDPEGFILSLNGGFGGFVKLKDRIIIFNDRFGYGKIYVNESQEGVVVGTSFNEVVRKLTRRTPNLIGILEFLRFGYPLYDQTFLKEIRLLPPGSRLEIDINGGKSIREQRYWEFEFHEDLTKSRTEMYEQLYQTLEEAVEDCFGDGHAIYAVSNSGGLDSSSILAIAKSKGFDFISYTFGSPGSDAIEIANRISNTLGLQQVNIDINTDFLPKYYKIHLERRPMITLSSLWYYTGVEQLLGCTTNVIGMYGDNTYGIHLVDKYLSMNSDWDNYTYHSLADDEYLANLTPLKYEGVRNHYKSIISACDQPDHVKRFDQWNFENRQFRFIMQEDWVNFLDEMEMRCPFMHNSLVDLAFTIPFEWRRNRILYQEAIKHHFHEISHIRLERYPYSVGYSYWGILGKKALWRLAKYIEKLIDWNPYFRGEHKHQREWLLSEPNYSFIEENLRRPSKLFSELFHQEKIAANVRSLLESNWSVTSNLLTIKLWLEQFGENVC